MQIGVSTACFYPMYTEEALGELLKTDTPCVEFFINADSELEDAYINELKRRCDDADVQVVALHPFLSGMEGLFFFSGYQRRTLDSREYYKRYYHAAALLGAGGVVFHGAHHMQQISMEQYVEYYSPLQDDAKAMGVQLCHENVVRCSGRYPEFFTRMSKLLPTARYVLDCKQAVRAGVKPIEMAKAMGEGIFHLHLSDHTATQDCLSPGQGEMDFCELFDLIRAQGFDGTAVVELYRNNFKDTELLEQGRRYIGNLW